MNIEKERLQKLIDAHMQSVFMNQDTEIEDPQTYNEINLTMRLITMANNDVDKIMDLAIEFNLKFDYGLWINHSKAKSPN